MNMVMVEGAICSDRMGLAAVAVVVETCNNKSEKVEEETCGGKGGT